MRVGGLSKSFQHIGLLLLVLWPKNVLLSRRGQIFFFPLFIFWPLLVIIIHFDLVCHQKKEFSLQQVCYNLTYIANLALDHFGAWHFGKRHFGTEILSLWTFLQRYFSANVPLLGSYGAGTYFIFGKDTLAPLIFLAQGCCRIAKGPFGLKGHYDTVDFTSRGHYGIVQKCCWVNMSTF